MKKLIDRCYHNVYIVLVRKLIEIILNKIGTGLGVEYEVWVKIP